MAWGVRVYGEMREERKVKNSRNAEHIKERLKDRRDYRQALINKRNEIDVRSGDQGTEGAKQ